MAIDGGSVEIRFEGDVAPLRRSIEEAVESLDDVRKAADDVDSSLSQSGFSNFGKKARAEFVDFSDAAGEAFSKAYDSADSFISKLGEIGTSIKGIGFGALSAGATGAATALVGLVKKGVQATDFLETSRTAMAGLTGSMQEGNKAMSMAAKYWQNKPFQRIDVTNATKQLVQFGRTTDQISSDLEMLGNVSLSTNMNIADLARYYARVSASGRAMTMDLEMMSDRGVPIYRELQKQLNTTTAGVREMASQGKIDFETFRKAMEGAVSKEAMDEFENTLSRQVDRFKGSIQILAGQLAGYKIVNNELIISEQGLEKAWTRMLKALATGLRSDNMKNAMEKIGNVLAKLVDKITTYVEPALNLLAKLLDFVGDNAALLVPILGGALVMFGKLGADIPVVGTVIQGISKNFGGLYSGLKDIIKLHPALSAVVALLGVGFIDALKNDAEFKQTIGELFSALKEIVSNLTEALKGILPILTQVIRTIAGSGVVKGILQAVANALTWIAQAVASLSPSDIAGILTFFASIKLLNASPIMFVVSALVLLIQYVKELGGISEVFRNLPRTLATIGHNLMTGLFNGIKEGASKIFNYVKQVASTIVSTFRNMFGIHSPSTVMYDMGINMGLGLANGITDSESAVQLAMNNLAEDILKLSEKIISNKVDFGILDIKQEWQEWKKVSKLFTQGSEQYNYALEKMEDARKKANLKILELQKTYNNELDTTIKKIASMYGLFDEVNLGGGKNSSKILKNLDQQVAKMQEWAEAQKSIANLGLDDELVKELQAMGVDATGELSAIAQMTADELGTLNDMWLKKQKIANEAGVQQMEGLKNETLDEINDLKKGIDGVTVDISDVGGRLVENISEGVYGAMPTLQSAFSQLNDYIEKAKKELAKTAGGGSDSGVGSTDTSGIGVPDTGVGELKEEITKTIGNIKDMLPKMLLGAIGAVGAVKFGPKIIKALGQKLFGGNAGLIGDAFKGFFGAAKAGEVSKNTYAAMADVFSQASTGNAQTFWATLSGKMANDEYYAEGTQAIKKTAKNITTTVQPAQSIGKGVSQISDSVATTGQGMSKATKWMSAIREGAKTIVYIAVAIAAIAGALWVTYNALKDVDFEKLGQQIGAMAGAVLLFGTLAGVAQHVGLDWKGILVIIGIAVDIAAIAVACKIAYEVMKDIPWDGFASVLGMMAATIATFGVLNGILGIPIIAIAEGLGLLVSAGIMLEIIGLSHSIKEAYDTMKDISWDGFGNMLGQMAATLGVMGALNGPLGLLMPLAALGWVTILAICDELTRTAEALYQVYKKVPDDFDGTTKKIDLIKTVLNKIIDTDLGSLIGSIVASWEVGPLTRIIDMYVYVAEQLSKLATIKLDKQAIENSLDYVKATLDSIKAKSDVITGWLEASALDMEASSVENAGRIVIVYGNMVDALNKLANFSPDEQAISASLTSMVGVITLLRNSSYGGGGLFNIFNNMDTVANDVEKIKSIVKNYLEMVPTMKSLGESENKISSKLATIVRTNIQNIKDIVLEIGSVDTGGWIDQKESDLGKIQSILNKYTELIPVANQIANMNIAKGDENSGAIKRIKAIKDIVLEIGSIDTGGWIDQKESDMGKIQSILNKFTEVAKTTQLLGKYPVSENATTWVQTVRNLVWEIGQINQSESGSLDAKAEIVEKSKNIAHKLGEFANIIKNIESVDKGSVIESLTSSLNQLLNGVSDSLTNKTGDMENIGSQLGSAVARGVGSQTEVITNAGIGLQSALWWSIQNKMQDEFYQGQAMANKFGDGLKSVNFDNIGAQMQTSLWWAIQNKMQDEYHQGQTMGNRFRQGLYDVDYGNAGWWAVKGFENGAWSLYGSVYNTGWWIANRFLQGLRDRGQQGSPWKTTMESGAWAVEGLIDGIKQEENALVGEATSLADQVVDALSMDNLIMSPTLDANVNGRLAPAMADGDYAIIGGNNAGVRIEQTNNNYTQYDVEQVQRDLAWELSKV